MVGKNKIILNLSHVLGLNSNRQSIIASASFVMVSLFYAYSIGSYLKLTIYPFENRIIYYELFHSFIFSQSIDHLIIICVSAAWLTFSVERRLRFLALLIYCAGLTLLTIAIGSYPVINIAAILSMPFIISLLIFNRFIDQKRPKILNKNANSLILNYFAIAGTVIGIIGFFISFVPLFSVPHSLLAAKNYEYDLYLILSSFSASLLLLLLSCVPMKIFILELRVAILRTKNINNSLLVVRNYDKYSSDSIKLKYKFIYLLLFMFLSTIIGLIPHQSQINFDNQQIGVDSDYYVKWINALVHAADYRDFINQAFIVQSFGDKPLTLTFLFTIAKILQVADFYFIVEHVSLILGPMLVLAVFFLTRELTLNDKQALLASFLTSVSFQVTIGIYAGFYANWLALIVGYLSFAFLVRSLRNSNDKLSTGMFLLLLIACLFAHVHTWSVMVVVMSIFMIITMKLKHYRKKRIVLLFILLSSSVMLDIVKTTVIGSTTGIEKDLEFAKATGTGIEQFAIRWSNLVRSVYSFLGGQFSNFIIYSLGAYWLLRSKPHEISSIFIMIFLSTGLLAFLIGDYRVQARIFYDIPFQIPAAIALSSLWSSRRGSFISIPICIWLLGLTVRTVSNFPLFHE